MTLFDVLLFVSVFVFVFSLFGDGFVIRISVVMVMVRGFLALC